MTRVSAQRAGMASGRLWRIAVLAAAGTVGASQAEAALYYSSDSDPGYARPAPTSTPRRQKPRAHQAKKIEAPEREQAKPHGPLIIAISIEKQNLKIYDDNGLFAEAPVSTGMKGHPTPTGVFSVIQKQKLHHSNIYSGAPMPFMQRITWSGIAIHAGVLPGYPASHGCIRMPMAFAMKMWNWTKMSARVIVTPGEISPASFSHPLLVAQKVAPQADAPPATKSDKASDAGTAGQSTISAASLELRSTVGHAEGAKPVSGEAPVSASLREQTHTADASGGMPSSQPSATMTDAASSAKDASPREEPVAQTDRASPIAEDAASATAPDASQPDAKPEAPASEIVKSEAEPPAAKSDATFAAQPDNDAAKADVSATGSMKTEEKREAKTEEVKPDPSKTDASANNPEAKKDQGRLPDTAKPASAKAEPAPSAAPKRTGQLAVFVSRKDSKLYVRQNLAPLFEVLVTIAPSDRPLGTHVFTAEVDKDDANTVRWSVVSLPVTARRAERSDDDERALRRRKIAGAAVEAKPMPVPDSPAEALDRLSIPADTMARITDALSTGASIIVSDQGINQGETGEGTDFIVSLR
jgi:lipoprotein-anchoring transpeptidase ErfK/SrfK